MERTNRYDLYFRAFLVSVVLAFFIMRPLNSPWHPFIAGDGLGYYSYLPAKFIYKDRHLTFEWFNEAHNANYVYSTFENPEDNLLVQYGDKKINKYYPGLAFIWMPFFFAGHLVAKVAGMPADGFSQPYQLAMCAASLFYLLLGLIFLRRLVMAITGNQFAALIAPAAVFFGSWLFTYAISANTLSHAYSFTFITLFLFFAYRFFHMEEKRTRNLLLAGLCLCLSVCIRPLTGIIVLLISALTPPGFWRRPGIWQKPRSADLLLALVIVLCLCFTLQITYTQTGSLFAYTYTNERFDFGNARFADALVSYHAGLFVYVPLILIALWGAIYTSPARRVWLLIFFFGVLFVYSAWWYWPIVKRAMVDFYAIPAIFVGILIAAASPKKRVLVLSLVALCVIYFQFKAMQLRRGILDENATYSEIFWRNFFRTRKANQYPIPPHTIIGKEEHQETFEAGFYGQTTTERAFSGNSALLLDSARYIARVLDLPFPALFEKEGFRKIRFSFNVFFEEEIGSAHIFMQFFDRNDKMIREVPFYLNADDIHSSEWDYKEFGHELVDVDVLNRNTVSHIGFTIWNVEAKRKMFIDNARAEFVLTDRSFETIK